MAKKKIEMNTDKIDKTEIGVVRMVGFRSTDRVTALYVEGGGESIGVQFRVFVEEGKYASYENSYSTSLVGKKVEYTYTGMDAMRSPTDAKFVEFVVEN